MTDQPNLPSGIAYLGTAYTKLPDLDRAFREAARIAEHLNCAGIPTFSPIVHGHTLAKVSGKDPKDPAVFEALNREMQKVCSVLIVTLMEGWPESDGLSDEIDYFEKHHKPIFDLDPRSLVMQRRCLFLDNEHSGSLTGDRRPSSLEQGGIADRLSNFDDWGNRVRDRS